MNASAQSDTHTADQVANQFVSTSLSHITHCESCISNIPTVSSREKYGNKVALFYSDSAIASRDHHSPCTQPNYTLASRVEGKSKSKGQPVSVRGFWGDIVCGPFAAFALEADEPRLFEARASRARGALMTQTR